MLILTHHLEDGGKKWTFVTHKQFEMIFLWVCFALFFIELILLLLDFLTFFVNFEAMLHNWVVFSYVFSKN